MQYLLYITVILAFLQENVLEAMTIEKHNDVDDLLRDKRAIVNTVF